MKDTPENRAILSKHFGHDLSEEHILLFTEDDDWSKLDPELQPYFTEHGPLGGPFLNHPLVQQIVLTNVNLANLILERKRAAAERARQQRNWSRYLYLHERPSRIPTLMQLVEEGTIEPGSDEHRALVLDMWIDTEYPKQFGYRKLVQMFRQAGFIGPGAPARPVEVFRGCLPADARGMSWTLDPRIAEKFARRQPAGAGRVYRTLARPHAVLAVVHDRDEQELVLDPRRLGAIARCAQPTVREQVDTPG